MQSTRHTLILPFCISLVIAFSASAQAPNPSVISNSYDVEMILPASLSRQDNLHDPVQDSMGYIWFSSVDGLHCYDGNSLITYEVRADSAHTGYFFMKLHRGYTLYIILNQAREVAVFDVRSRQVVRRITLPTDSGLGTFLGEDGNGDVYLLAYGNQFPTTILCLSDSTRHPLRLPMQEIITAYAIFEGNHWIQTNSGFECFDDAGELIESLSAHDIPDMTYMAGIFDGDLLFYSRTEAAIYQWDSIKKGLKLQYRVPSTFDRKAFDFYPDEDQIWLEHTPRDLFLWNPIKGTIQDYTRSITDMTLAKAPQTLANELGYFLRLRNGHMLLFYGNSIFRLSPRTSDSDIIWENISSGNDLTSMRGLAEDEVGNIYASYYTGVSVKQVGSDRFKEFRDTKRAKKFKENTYSLTYTKDKLIWNNIVFDLKSGERKSIERDGYGLHMNHCLAGDTLWTYMWYANKLSIYDIKNGTAYTFPEKLFSGDESASRMVADPYSALIYLATTSQGICAISRTGKVVQQYTSEELGLPPGRGNIYDLVIDKDHIWFGSEFGLGILNRLSHDVTYYEVPISNNSVDVSNRIVYNIIENENGNFYLGTSHGLVEFQKTSRTFLTLPKDHVLNQLEFNRNSVLKASDGRYYLGTINGLISFMPDALPFRHNTNTAAAPLLSSISILNGKSKTRREMRSGLFGIETLRLKSTDTQVSFAYSTPTEDDDILYSHRILPLDSVWSDFNTKGQTDILSFLPGDYTLEVMATTVPKSGWGNITRLNIYMPRVWYQQWWAIAFFILVPFVLTIILLRWLFHQKLRRQIEMENLRTKISSDLHDDVGSILSGLAMQSEMMSYATKDDEEKSSLRQLSEMSREAMDRMRDTVWAIDSRKDKYGNLIDRMRAHAESVLQKKDIEHSFEIGSIDPQQFISPAVRQNIYLIFKEAITNIIRHSNATFVQISLHNNGQNTEFTIQDNGTKLNNSKSDGLGISNMKMRAEAMNGSISIGFDEGFRVCLVVADF